MIYFDNASTTRVGDNVSREITAVNTEIFGNPSSLHELGIAAEEKITDAKKTILKKLSADGYEIKFLSGGTEANAWAVKCTLNARKRRMPQYVLDAASHESVYFLGEELKNEGFSVSFAAPDKGGAANGEKIIDAVKPETGLVSLILVNNETGAKTNAYDIIKKIKRKNPETIVHIDCVSAFCKEEINLKKLNADIITVSAHKIHGPKGMGAIIYKKGIRLSPLYYEGGTAAVALIAGFKKAVEEEKIGEKVGEINAFLRKELSKIDGIEINSPENASEYILNFSTCKIKSEILLHYLEEKGIYVSSGSACSKGKQSRVLSEMKLPRERILTAIRLSFSKENTIEEAKIFIDTLKTALGRIQRGF